MIKKILFMLLVAMSVLLTSCCDCGNSNSYQTMLMRDITGDTIVLLERIPVNEWRYCRNGIGIGHEYYCGNITMYDDTNELKGVYTPMRAETQTIVLYSELGDTLQMIEHVDYSDWMFLDCGGVKVGNNYFYGCVTITDEDETNIVYKPSNSKRQRIIMYDPLGDTVQYIDNTTKSYWTIKGFGQLMLGNSEVFCGTFAILEN